jgi:hypothetical protein
MFSVHPHDLDQISAAKLVEQGFARWSSVCPTGPKIEFEKACHDWLSYALFNPLICRVAQRFNIERFPQVNMISPLAVRSFPKLRFVQDFCIRHRFPPFRFSPLHSRQMNGERIFPFRISSAIHWFAA